MFGAIKVSNDQRGNDATLLARDKDIVGLEVAMNDTAVVQALEAVDEAVEKATNLSGREVLASLLDARELLGEVSAVARHKDAQLVGQALVAEVAGDVGVARQGGRELDLGLKGRERGVGAALEVELLHGAGPAVDRALVDGGGRTTVGRDAVLDDELVEVDGDGALGGDGAGGGGGGGERAATRTLDRGDGVELLGDRDGERREDLGACGREAREDRVVGGGVGRELRAEEVEVEAGGERRAAAGRVRERRALGVGGGRAGGLVGARVALVPIGLLVAGARRAGRGRGVEHGLRVEVGRRGGDQQLLQALLHDAEHENDGERRAVAVLADETARMADERRVAGALEAVEVRVVARGQLRRHEDRDVVADEVGLGAVAKEVAHERVGADDDAARRGGHGGRRERVDVERRRRLVVDHHVGHEAPRVALVELGQRQHDRHLAAILMARADAARTADELAVAARQVRAQVMVVVGLVHAGSELRHVAEQQVLGRVAQEVGERLVDAEDGALLVGRHRRALEHLEVDADVARGRARERTNVLDPLALLLLVLRLQHDRRRVQAEDREAELSLGLAAAATLHLTLGDIEHMARLVGSTRSLRVVLLEVAAAPQHIVPRPPALESRLALQNSFDHGHSSSHTITHNHTQSHTLCSNQNVGVKSWSSTGLVHGQIATHTGSILFYLLAAAA